jgi:hypothetical protein
VPSRGPQFEPRFTLLLVYVAGFFLLYALLFALPALLGALGELPPGAGPLTPEELDRARDASRDALTGGRVLIALVAALATTGFGLWRDALPGVRRSR